MRNKFIFYVIVFHLFVFRANGQSQFAVMDFEKVNQEVQQEIIATDSRYQALESLPDTIMMHCIHFVQYEHQWAQKRTNGGCLSLKETQMMENYVHHLYNEIKEIENDFEKFQEEYDKETLSLIKVLSEKWIKNQAQFKPTLIVLEASSILYHDPLVPDLTSEIFTKIVEDLNHTQLDTLFSSLDPIAEKMISRKMHLLGMNYSKYKAQFENQN